MASPSTIVMFLSLKTALDMVCSYIRLSTCALGDQTDLPFDLLSILNCNPETSVVFAIKPPKTSISLTICPLATPPIAGLQDILPTLFLSIVIKDILQPVFEAILAASTPA